MFKEARRELLFDWGMIGDIGAGRPNLGPHTDVSIYRLMQFTLRDVMIHRLGVQATDDIFRTAGELAGREFCRNFIDTAWDFNTFFTRTKDLLEQLKVGMLRVESADLERMELTLTVAEDLDCSGLPVCDETVCVYDEGFLAGLLGEYSGKPFAVKEVDCWCSGDRVCRFHATPLDDA
ncbi:V4R domain-containing protein [Megalodesulfovibrio gigas]|uniref:Putative 4-vinyl reductase 4VR n=1 Tax=Megalodesulfovibrio gigas (strain ATCC 19364 / DSM 1382 / NCIMB 9332 / VKM B-1759) TaxID=1121448 RepID=T2GEU4_MEGG1|nr:4-vinyl reductase [Megalodesulfovibrio gigas]AGW14689.1 putative 4-vinyl reductase 4VR [Megalodesulfovibrio gigas DSM 1382 = ATCC 19364]